MVLWVGNHFGCLWMWVAAAFCLVLYVGTPGHSFAGVLYFLYMPCPAAGHDDSWSVAGASRGTWISVRAAHTV
jgi:hypothetical protein